MLNARFESHKDVVGALLRGVVRPKRGEEGMYATDGSNHRLAEPQTSRTTDEQNHRLAEPQTSRP